MKRLAVIIPYYQREAGILSRSLRSVLRQQPADGWRYETIIVDDGSPHPVDEELAGFAGDELENVRIMRQANAGPCAARNAALDMLEDHAAVAFLDSDDEWPDDHLQRAIASFDAGYDFYFTDNSRVDFHDTYITGGMSPRTLALINQTQQRTGVLDVSPSVMLGLIISEFPCQISSVVFAQEAARRVRFNGLLRDAGEDLVYLVEVVMACRRVGLDLDSRIGCGRGVNIYFGQFDWDSLNFISIRLDAFLTHKIIQRLAIGHDVRAINREFTDKSRLQFAFHLLRLAPRHPDRIGRALLKLWRVAPDEALRLPFAIGQAAAKRLADARPATVKLRGF